MAKKKLKTSKSTPVKKGKGGRRPRAKNAAPVVQIGTKCIGQVAVSYVQTAVPEKHAKDVADVLAQLILSDAHRGYVGVTHRDENDGF